MKRAQSDHLNQVTHTPYRQQRVSIVFSLITQTLLFLAIAFVVYVIVVNIQFKKAMQQQVNAIGNSLVEQVSERAVELLTIDDKLGLNIVLGNLARNTLVTDVAVLDLSGKELFRAGLRRSNYNKELGSFCKPLIVQQKETSKLCLHLDMEQFQAPWVVSVERTIIIGVGLLLIGLAFSFRLGRKIISPVIQLREWLRDPIMPAPAIERTDELGDLAYDLQAKLISSADINAYYAQREGVETVDDSELPEDDLPELRDFINNKVNITENHFKKDINQALNKDNFDQGLLEKICSLDERNKREEEYIAAMQEVLEDVPVINDIVPETILPVIQTAVLFIKLGAQQQLQLLPKERLINLLQRYRDCLNQAVRLYRGEIHTLNDGSSLVLFHARGSETDSYLLHAICCGELMRALSHELQIELVETNIVLLLQMALTKGSELLGLTPSELADNEAVQAAQALAEYSRNLLLIDRTVTEDNYVEKLARIRKLATPTDAYCIERVLDPYAAVLEKQLRNMRNNQL